jgi:hypothetical protein
MTVSKTIEQLKQLFNRVDEVFYSENAIAAISELTTGMALPVGSDGVSFDAGDPDITKYKLTTGEIWTAIADAGDADISFQVPSIHEDIAKLFQNQITTEDETLILDGVTYKGKGYDFAPKKVTGSLVLRSQDKSAVIVLPNVEIFATTKLDDTSKPLYFNLSVTPENNSKGVAIYYMNASAA